LDAVLLDLEKIMLQRALKLSPRNRAQAARLLGISRPRLLRRIEQLGLGDDPPADQD
jgi:DNA-binding NtrC family response regulator